MTKRRSRKAFTIVELVIVIAVIAILATVLVPTFGDVISKAKDSSAMQEAKNAYTNYLIENNGEASEYMVYDADGRFVALHNGAAVGVYENTDIAISALVDNPNDYCTVKSLTKKMYHVLNPFEYIGSSEYIGKTIACIGDSVTTPDHVTGGGSNYVAYLGSVLGTIPINLGTSGYVLCTGGHRYCQIGMLSDSELRGADIVTIYLGVNDWDQARTDYYDLGDINSTDTSTIYGAMKMWCDKIIELKNTEKYMNTEFFFITPHITSWNNSVSQTDWSPQKTNVHGYTQKDMRDVITNVCRDYDIPVIDVYDYTSKLYIQDPGKYVAEYGGDGIHPTTAGHKLISDYILACIAAQNAVG